MRAPANRVLVASLAVGLSLFSLGTPVSASPARTRAPAAATLPITINMPAAANATLSQAQYSSQDVWAGVLSAVNTPPSGISALQRLKDLNPPNFRIHAGTDGGIPSVDLPFNAPYTSSDNLSVGAWDFNHLNSLIANTVGRTSGSTMLNVRYAPDNMFGGTGPLGGNGNAPGGLLDQTYTAFATYMANLVKYYNTATPPPGATPTRPANIGPIRFWEIWNEPDFSSENPRIPPSLSPPTGITAKSVGGGTLAAGTYSYRITPLTGTNQEGLPSATVSATVGASGAVKLTWNPSVNLGLVATAYIIYGRTGGGGQMVVVGKDNPGGLSWTDNGSVTPGGNGPPAGDSTPGGPVFSPLQYKAMWDKVVPAMKAVDPTIKVVGPVTTNPISIASGSVDPSVVTTGPNDSSYLDTRDYVQVLMTSINKPDVVSYHGYGGYQGNVDTDSSLMSTIPQIAADVQSNILPYVGTTPIWHTEANVNAGDDSKNRPALAFGAAWQASLFAKLAPIGVSTIHEYSYVQSPTFGLIAESGSPVAGAVEGNPYLPYWVEYWIDHLFAPGAKILSVANVPAGFDVLAVANPPDFSKVKVLVVNRQVPATSTAASVQLAGATSSATRARLIDSATDLVNGPALSSPGAVQTVNLQLNGYSVGLVEFDTAAGPPPSPVVTGLAPSSGPTSGGTSVTISGSGFTGATAVTFGATAATGVTVNNDGSITATSPAGSAGTVDVTVTTPGGTSTTSAADHFTYLAPPVVTGVAPTRGPTSGGTSVTIAGSGFTGATVVKFGAAAATGVVVTNDSSIRVTSPAGTGTVDITVTAPGGTSAANAADHFTYAPAPVVTGVVPNSGSSSGGTSVTISGSGFTGATGVKFGAAAATGVSVSNDVSITATSPAGTGTVDITVTAPGGVSATSVADRFTYVPPGGLWSRARGAAPQSAPNSWHPRGSGLTTVGVAFRVLATHQAWFASPVQAPLPIGRRVHPSSLLIDILDWAEADVSPLGPASYWSSSAPGVRQ